VDAIVAVPLDQRLMHELGITSRLEVVLERAATAG
jgi:hypothetical protein